jgi:hypothetical protein
MVYDTGYEISATIQQLPYKKFMGYLLVYILITGIPLAVAGYYGVSIILMLSLTLLFTGVIGVIIFGIGTIYFTQKILPEEYKLGILGVTSIIIALVLMSIPALFFVI